ncbi:MAG: protein phosphatase 2C domain-containing protein [Pseudomonadota bacterium]
MKRLEFATCTHQGRVRRNNEDAVGSLDHLGVLIVADGMGGCQAGEVASHMAVDLVLSHLVQHLTPELAASGVMIHLKSALMAANEAIYERSLVDLQLHGMGTTAVVAAFGLAHLAFAHVGDSRLYRLRNGQLECLTRDHTVIQELIDRDEFPGMREALAAGVNPNVLTRALGSEGLLQSDLGVTPCQIDDLYLLCTDGLTGMVAEPDISAVLAEPIALAGRAERLVAAACARGGVDNVTVALAHVSSISD